MQLPKVIWVQACLGAKAKPGERNVVELTAEDENGQEVTHSILSLNVGGMEQVRAREEGGGGCISPALGLPSHKAF